MAKRRSLAFVTLAASAALLLSACASGGDSSDSGSQDTEGPLRVGAYGSTWTEAVKATAAKAFTEETGVEVEYVEGNPSDVAAQIYATSAQGAEPPVDVLTTDDPTQTQLAQRELLVPVSEYADKVEGLFENVPTEANNEGYAPPVCDWYITLTYNKPKFAELGLPEPTSWDDLFASELAGRVAIPDITTAMGLPFIFAVSDGEGMSAGIDKIATLDTYSVYTSSGDMQSDMANGNIWAAATVDGRGWGMVDSDPEQFGAIIPEVAGADGKIGPRAGSCYYDIVKDTPRLDLAAKFMSHIYADETQAEFAAQTGYIPSSPSAIDLLISKDGKWADRIPEIDTTVPVNWQEVVPNIADLTDEFNRKLG